MHLKTALRLQARRCLVLALNTLLNHDAVYALIGMINRRLRFLTSVFVAYPASEKYAAAYVFPRFMQGVRWRPWLGGAYVQNGKLGLTMVVSSTEQDFTDPANSVNLRGLVERAERIRTLLGASQSTFAGILPSILSKRGIVRRFVEGDVTAAVIALAEREVRQCENLAEGVPVLVLGGRGFVGRRTVQRLARDGREVVSVDIDGHTGPNLEEWPSRMQGKPAVLVNVSRKSALASYASLLWPGLVVLNDVYPEPSYEEVAAMSRFGVPCYHIVGVKGWSVPRFPNAYEGGIPCCAARVCADLHVIVRKLDPMLHRGKGP